MLAGKGIPYTRSAAVGLRLGIQQSQAGVGFLAGVEVGLAAGGGGSAGANSIGSLGRTKNANIADMGLDNPPSLQRRFGGDSAEAWKLICSALGEPDPALAAVGVAAALLRKEDPEWNRIRGRD